MATEGTVNGMVKGMVYREGEPSVGRVWCGTLADIGAFARTYICGHDCDDALASVVHKLPHVNKQDKTGIIQSTNGMLLGMEHHSGNVTEVEPIMPAIINVDVKYSKGDEKEPKAVYVTFADFTTEKAKLSSEDVFTVEQGISICVAKKLVSIITGFDNAGGSLYNKIIKHGLKVCKQSVEAEELRKKTAAEREDKLKKVAERKKARDQRRLEKKREDAISAQSEAIYRAMRRLEDEKNQQWGG